jgi:2-dehydropantoate 2-reductase
MRIVIFGTGGAGGYFGAQLARAGEDVVFIARGEHLNAIRTHGLRIEEPTGETVIQPPPRRQMILRRSLASMP